MFAGMASAATNDTIAYRAFGYNSNLLVVKTSSDNDTLDPASGLVFAFEGVVYAADRGAKVINCSWGQTERTSSDRIL